MASDREIVAALVAKLGIELTPYKIEGGEFRERVEYNAVEQLVSLDLFDLTLTELPTELFYLIHLTSLSLRSNNLSSLPPDIGQLGNLTSLDLSSNKISSLPPEIAQLRGLRELRLNNNPWIEPPPEIALAENNIQAILPYFTELSSANKIDYLNEVKLVLVGEGRVGKTSLAKALSTPGYSLEDEQSTEGITIRPWIIPGAQLGLPKDFRVNIWDFGGQEIYHATHQFFLTKRSVYLLVTESRKEDKHEDFYYWLNIIQLLGGSSPVIIVLNKCDQPTKDLPINEYQQAFSNIVDFEKVSCAVGYQATIDILQAKIQRIITGNSLLPHIGSPLPKAWVDIREALEGLNQAGHHYISLDHYLALCQERGLDEERAMYLSDFFHDLGVMLHFRDDLVLRETIFLNHEWVTAGVYAVLDNRQVKANQGRFSDSDLIHIWGEAKYKEKRQELLALMKDKKFELCYQIGPGQYLAPQLLPVDAVPYEWRTDDNNLHFEYRYKFMPKGMLARFIIKRHQDIYQQTHWRYGVLLEYENTRALVRERYFERKITITLEGTNKKGFLDIIRKTMQEVHQDFHNLQVEEMIPCNCQVCGASQEPFMHKYSDLLRFRHHLNKHTRECPKSGLEIDIDRLIGDVIITRLDIDMDRLINDVRIHHYGSAGVYIQDVLSDYPLATVVQRFLESAEFELNIQEATDPIRIIAISQHEIWKRRFENGVYIEAVAQSPNSDSIYEIRTHAHESNWRIKHALLITNRTLEPAEWLMIHALEAMDFTIIPIPSDLFSIPSSETNATMLLLNHIDKRLGADYDPYKEMGAVYGPGNFFGRGDLLNKLETSLLKGNSQALFGIRKLGKSSILYHLASKIPLPVAILDLQREGLKPHHLYTRMLSEWATSAESKFNIHWSSQLFSRNETTRGDFLTAMEDLLKNLQPNMKKPRLAFFIDEGELLVPARHETGKKLADYLEIMEVLRTLSSGKLNVLSILYTSFDPSLIRISHWGKLQNPAYQLFEVNYLNPLLAVDCEQMIRSLGQQVKLEYSQEAINLIYEVSGGHPFIARQLCSLAFKQMKKEGKLDGQVVPELLREIIGSFIYNPDTASHLNHDGLWGVLTQPAIWGKQEAQLQGDLLRFLAAEDGPHPISKFIQDKNSAARRAAVEELKNFCIIKEVRPEYYDIIFGCLKSWIQGWQL